MADRHPPQSPTGGRDDLQVDVSRCLRMRFNESGCRRCAAVCPHDAVNLGDGLSINPQRCTGCLLCTADCPVGALEQSSDFLACLAQLSRVPEPIIGCLRSKESSHAALACLGGLSEEHLVTLCYSLPATVTLNLTACRDCPNSTMISQLQQRLDDLSEAGMPGISGQIVVATSVQGINYLDETVDRRSFFKSLRNSLFHNAAMVLSSSNTTEGNERRTEYARKRLPVRRELLNRVRKCVSPDQELLIAKRFDCSVTFDDRCTSCHGCAAICPTGALQIEHPDLPPGFDPLLCTGCGLCREFCLDGALRIAGSGETPEKTITAS